MLAYMVHTASPRNNVCSLNPKKMVNVCRETCRCHAQESKNWEIYKSMRECYQTLRETYLARYNRVYMYMYTWLCVILLVEQTFVAIDVANIILLHISLVEKIFTQLMSLTLLNFCSKNFFIRVFTYNNIDIWIITNINISVQHILLIHHIEFEVILLELE